MITVEISGGLGNQMYKYAFGYAMAKKYHQPLCIDTAISDHVDFRKFGLDAFRVRYDKRITYHRGIRNADRLILNRFCRWRMLRGYQTISQQSAYRYEPDAEQKLGESGNYYLNGNWANYRYFDKDRPDLKSVFLPKETDAEIEELASRIHAEESVAVHVRRGDYITLGIAMNEDYYRRAYKLMETRHPDKELRYYVFSDDIAYSKKLFAPYDRGSIHFLSYQNPNKTVFDMYLMRQCRHLIIANSTYSWWAAYLAEDHADVVAPVGGIWSAELYPEHWHTIDLQG